MGSSGKIRVLKLSFVHYQHPDLKNAEGFLADFGFHEAHREDGKIYFAGFGEEPYLYVAEQSPDSKRHFLGGAWTVASEDDLKLAAEHPTSSGIQELKAPGGGSIVTIKDPNGFSVHFVYGQKKVESRHDGTDKDFTRDTVKEPKHQVTPNGPYEKVRRGQFRRFETGPSPIHKLGHYGYIMPPSKYEEVFEFYTTLMNLKPTDSVYDPESGKDKTCFLHIDLGPDFTDHHSFFMGAGLEEQPAYVHHSSYEVNDFDTQQLGHNWLENKGWKNCWGIGRHVLGSQIFDYWFDASGNVVEHYSDGDLVNEKTPFERSPEAPDSLYVWGPNIPLAFLTGRVEDAGKQLPPPPVEVPAVAA